MNSIEENAIKSMIKYTGAVGAPRIFGMIYSILRAGDIGLDTKLILDILDYHSHYGGSAGYKMAIVSKLIKKEMEDDPARFRL